LSGTAAHDRFRTRLEALATDRSLLAGLPADGEWRRTYGRFTPEAESYATLVYESVGEMQSIVRVDAFERRPEGDRPAHVDDVGWLRWTRFPHDAALPTLGAAVGNTPHVRVVRYRPGRRCTLALGDPPERYTKVFSDDRCARLYVESCRLWDAARREKLAFAVAQPLAFDERARTLTHAALPGSPARGLLDAPDGERLAVRMGEATASLGCASLAPPRHGGPEVQLERCKRSASQLERLMPGLAATLAATLARIGALHAEAATRPLRPAHGAPHVPQWLVDGDAVALVDFDRHCLADPELDAAAVMVSMEEECEQGGRLAASFLASYENAGGPLRPSVLAAYRAQRLLAKALNAARALRPDADHRAERRLRGLERILEASA
jgi:hypothetical protein